MEDFRTSADPLQRPCSNSGKQKIGQSPKAISLCSRSCQNIRAKRGVPAAAPPARPRAHRPRQISSNFQVSLRKPAVCCATIYCMQRDWLLANESGLRDNQFIRISSSLRVAAARNTVLDPFAISAPRGHDVTSTVGTPGRLKLLELLGVSHPKRTERPSFQAGYAKEPIGAYLLPHARFAADVSPPNPS